MKKIDHGRGLIIEWTDDEYRRLMDIKEGRVVFEKGIRTDLRGEKSPRSKLKVFQVIEILESYDTLRSAAKKYNVSMNVIFGIRHGIAWKHLQHKNPRFTPEEVVEVKSNIRVGMNRNTW